MTTKFAAYRKSFHSNPDAFMEGVVSFCKQASRDDRSLLEKLFPWVLGIGGLYGASLLGDAWGRYANKNGIDMGPVRGPLSVMFNKFLPEGKRIQLGSVQITRTGSGAGNGQGQ